MVDAVVIMVGAVLGMTFVCLAGGVDHNLVLVDRHSGKLGSFNMR